MAEWPNRQVTSCSGYWPFTTAPVSLGKLLWRFCNNCPHPPFQRASAYGIPSSRPLFVLDHDKASFTRTLQHAGCRVRQWRGPGFE
jgi:hypothetical protein